MFQYEAVVLRIVDGDTLWLNVDLGFHVHVEVDVRLARINAPETVTWTTKGLMDPARQYLETHVGPGTSCIVSITKTDKYGRWLADLYYKPGSTDRGEILRDPLCVNDELMQNGLAAAYGR